MTQRAMFTDTAMRAFIVGALALLISSCATPAQRAAEVQRDVDDMIQVYGPGCEKLGFKPDTDQWRDCVLRLADRDYQRFTRAPVTTNCVGHRGFFQCTTF
jgi:hypothetical protein